MWDFQLFSVLSRYIVLETVTGTDGKVFFFEFYSLYSFTKLS